MSKKEDFKRFASAHPELMNHVQNGRVSWQQLYSIYDIYGETDDRWNEYLNVKDRANKTTNFNLNNLPDFVKNINMDSIQKHIGTAQKALGFFQEMTTKNTGSGLGSALKGPVSPRPINKFFED